MLRPIAGLALALLVAPLARAGDDFTWDPARKHAPQAGERSFKEGELVEKERSSTTMNGKVVEDTKREAKTSYRFSTEVVAVVEGKVTEARVKIERWRRVVADQEDKGLEGKTLVIKGKPGEQTFALEGDKGAEVTSAAKAWIERSLLARPEKLMPGLPPKPVAPDGEWTLDPALLADSLFNTKQIVAEESSVKGKLTRVHVDDGVHVGHVDIAMKIKLRKFPGTQFDITEGGVLDMTIAFDAPLEDSKRHAMSATIEAALAARAKVDAPKGGSGVIESSVVRTETFKSGPVDK